MTADELSVEKVSAGKGWERIDHMARLWGDGPGA